MQNGPSMVLPVIKSLAVPVAAAVILPFLRYSNIFYLVSSGTNTYTPELSTGPWATVALRLHLPHKRLSIYRRGFQYI